MWVDFHRHSKRAYPCYKLQIPPLHRENLDVQKENVPRLFMPANQAYIAKMLTESLPVPCKEQTDNLKVSSINIKISPTPIG